MPGKKEIVAFRNAALSVTRWIGSPSSLIVHTILFILSFVASALGYISFQSMLLVLTTIVSLEAIYLSIFIQMTINFTTASLEEVEQDIDEIQEDVGEIQEDIDELQEDVEEMSEEDKAEEREEEEQQKTLAQIQSDLRKLVQDIEKLQHHPRQ
jgi:biopolymer transport protein ExbB/TolQ